MSRLSEIPVRVELKKAKENNLAIAHRVLLDIKSLLADWLTTGHESAIDLKNVPKMQAATYQSLKSALAMGEVSMVIEAEVRIEIHETQYPGVWWLTHFNEKGDIVTEIIEIAQVPAILKPHPAEVKAGMKRLEQLLSESEWISNAPRTLN